MTDHGQQHGSDDPVRLVAAQLGVDLDPLPAGRDHGQQHDQGETPTCPRCGSLRWVSVSLDGGWTRRAQCVPCGAYHAGSIGPGWRSSNFNDPAAHNPAYREDASRA